MNFSRNDDSKLQLKSNYLRKGEGSGGASTRFLVGMRDPSSGRGYKLPKGSLESPERGDLIPMVRPDPEKMTVRVRTKDGFNYGKGSLYGKFGQSKFSEAMDYNQDQGQNMLWHMKQ